MFRFTNNVGGWNGMDPGPPLFLFYYQTLLCFTMVFTDQPPRVWISLSLVTCHIILTSRFSSLVKSHLFGIFFLLKIIHGRILRVKRAASQNCWRGCEKLDSKMQNNNLLHRQGLGRGQIGNALPSNNTDFKFCC